VIETPNTAIIIFIIIIDLLLVITSMYGCCGGIKEPKSMETNYASGHVIAFILEIIAAVYLIVYLVYVSIFLFLNSDIIS